MPHPRRPRSHVIEDIAKAKLYTLFSNAGWTTETIVKDYGEDLLVSIFEKGVGTPYKFFVQSKATDNLNRYLIQSRRAISFPVETDLLRHWTSLWEPVFLVVYDANTKNQYWRSIHSWFEEATLPRPLKQLKTKVHVPLSNKLNQATLSRVRDVTAMRFGRYDCHVQGTKALLALLKELAGLSIEYSPENETLILPVGRFVREAAGGSWIVSFGKLGDLLHRVSDEVGIPGEVLSRGLVLRNGRRGKIRFDGMTPSESDKVVEKLYKSAAMAELTKYTRTLE